jgi:glutamine synthetase
MTTPPLAAALLEELIRDGEIDTVLVCLPDWQGRLMGKRVTGPFWSDVVVHEGIEACDYLVANDTDMNPVPGYAFTNYETGYGDMLARPDLDTLRLVPWLERTALVLCDLYELESDEPVEVSPRQLLRRQVEQAATAGYTVKLGPEFEFFLFRESYEEAAAKGYRDLTPHSDWVLDYHILQTTRDEYVIRDIRNGLEGAGIAVEFSKGEAGFGQHEINLRYGDALPMADAAVIYKNAAKEIAAAHGRSVSFMAKWNFDHTGSSCHVHSSVWDAADGRSLMADDGHGLGKVGRWWLGGLLATAAELAICFAPNVNSYKRYQPFSWAPTALGWAVDNRTWALRQVGHGDGCRVESRIPGSDTNPYLAFAATVAGGLHGIDSQLDPGAPRTGNGWEAEDVPHIPSTIVEAIDLFRDSAVAKAAFGEAVHAHLLNFADQEWRAFNAAVTDWERRRYFERW